MVFNSLVFLLFFGVVMLVRYAPLSWRARKTFLLASSYVFYGAWNPPFVLLLLLSTATDWFLAARIHRATLPRTRRWLLVGSLAVNLGLLAFFKYGSFLLDNWVHLLSLAGIDFRPAAPNIILPVGISFYTFQTLSYTLDVYARREKPWGSLLDFSLYVTFFPQLVAGPIVRSSDFLPQCASPRQAPTTHLGWGFTLLLMGLFLKVTVADALLAPAADKVFQPGVHPDFIGAWLGVLAFSGQIFCDFAGYSTCAIGAASCLGFSFNRNFRCPYAAVGFSDFWKRWHISLSSWLRDYLYIPLGGNRRGKIRTDANLLTTMLLGGLWHGASWTFVVWGGLHGTYLIAERGVRRIVERLGIRATPPALLLGCLVTYLLVCVTWTFFRSKTFEGAFILVRAMAGLAPDGSVRLLNLAESLTVAIVTITMLSFHWFLRERDLRSLVVRTPWFLRGGALALLILLLISVSGEDRAFIYFQF